MDDYQSLNGVNYWAQFSQFLLSSSRLLSAHSTNGLINDQSLANYLQDNLGLEIVISPRIIFELVHHLIHLNSLVITWNRLPTHSITTNPLETISTSNNDLNNNNTKDILATNNTHEDNFGTNNLLSELTTLYDFKHDDMLQHMDCSNDSNLSQPTVDNILSLFAAVQSIINIYDMVLHQSTLSNLGSLLLAQSSHKIIEYSTLKYEEMLNNAPNPNLTLSSNSILVNHKTDDDLLQPTSIHHNVDTDAISDPKRLISIKEMLNELITILKVVFSNYISTHVISIIPIDHFITQISNILMPRAKLGKNDDDQVSIPHLWFYHQSFTPSYPLITFSHTTFSITKILQTLIKSINSSDSILKQYLVQLSNPIQSPHITQTQIIPPQTTQQHSKTLISISENVLLTSMFYELLRTTLPHTASTQTNYLVHFTSLILPLYLLHTSMEQPNTLDPIKKLSSMRMSEDATMEGLNHDNTSSSTSSTSPFTQYLSKFILDNFALALINSISVTEKPATLAVSTIQKIIGLCMQWFDSIGSVTQSTLLLSNTKIPKTHLYHFYHTLFEFSRVRPQIIQENHSSSIYPIVESLSLSNATYLLNFNTIIDMFTTMYQLKTCFPSLLLSTTLSHKNSIMTNKMIENILNVVVIQTIGTLYTKYNNISNNNLSPTNSKNCSVTNQNIPIFDQKWLVEWDPSTETMPSCTFSVHMTLDSTTTHPHPHSQLHDSIDFSCIINKTCSSIPNAINDNVIYNQLIRDVYSTSHSSHSQSPLQLETVLSIITITVLNAINQHVSLSSAMNTNNSHQLQIFGITTAKSNNTPTTTEPTIFPPHTTPLPPSTQPSITKSFNPIQFDPTRDVNDLARYSEKFDAISASFFRDNGLDMIERVPISALKSLLSSQNTNNINAGLQIHHQGDSSFEIVNFPPFISFDKIILSSKTINMNPYEQSTGIHTTIAESEQVKPGSASTPRENISDANEFRLNYMNDLDDEMPQLETANDSIVENHAPDHSHGILSENPTTIIHEIDLGGVGDHSRDNQNGHKQHSNTNTLPSYIQFSISHLVDVPIKYNILNLDNDIDSCFVIQYMNTNAINIETFTTENWFNVMQTSQKSISGELNVFKPSNTVSILKYLIKQIINIQSDHSNHATLLSYYLLCVEFILSHRSSQLSDLELETLLDMINKLRATISLGQSSQYNLYTITGLILIKIMILFCFASSNNHNETQVVTNKLTNSLISSILLVGSIAPVFADTFCQLILSSLASNIHVNHLKTMADFNPVLIKMKKSIKSEQEKPKWYFDTVQDILITLSLHNPEQYSPYISQLLHISRYDSNTNTLWLPNVTKPSYAIWNPAHHPQLNSQLVNTHPQLNQIAIQSHISTTPLLYTIMNAILTSTYITPSLAISRIKQTANNPTHSFPTLGEYIYESVPLSLLPPSISTLMINFNETVNDTNNISNNPTMYDEKSIIISLPKFLYRHTQTTQALLKIEASSIKNEHSNIKHQPKNVPTSVHNVNNNHQDSKLTQLLTLQHKTTPLRYRSLTHSISPLMFSWSPLSLLSQPVPNQQMLLLKFIETIKLHESIQLTNSSNNNSFSEFPFLPLSFALEELSPMQKSSITAHKDSTTITQPISFYTLWRYELFALYKLILECHYEVITMLDTDVKNHVPVNMMFSSEFITLCQRKYSISSSHTNSQTLALTSIQPTLPSINQLISVYSNITSYPVLSSLSYINNQSLPPTQVKTGTHESTSVFDNSGYTRVLEEMFLKIPTQELITVLEDYLRSQFFPCQTFFTPPSYYNTKQINPNDNKIDVIRTKSTFSTFIPALSPFALSLLIEIIIKRIDMCIVFLKQQIIDDQNNPHQYKQFCYRDIQPELLFYPSPGQFLSRSILLLFTLLFTLLPWSQTMTMIEYDRLIKTVTTHNMKFPTTHVKLETSVKQNNNNNKTLGNNQIKAIERKTESDVQDEFLHLIPTIKSHPFILDNMNKDTDVTVLSSSHFVCQTLRKEWIAMWLDQTVVGGIHHKESHKQSTTHIDIHTCSSNIPTNNIDPLTTRLDQELWSVSTRKLLHSRLQRLEQSTIIDTSPNDTLVNSIDTSSATSKPPPKNSKNDPNRGIEHDENDPDNADEHNYKSLLIKSATSSYITQLRNSLAMTLHTLMEYVPFIDRILSKERANQPSDQPSNVSIERKSTPTSAIDTSYLLSSKLLKMFPTSTEDVNNDSDTSLDDIIKTNHTLLSLQFVYFTTWIVPTHITTTALSSTTSNSSNSNPTASNNTKPVLNPLLIQAFKLIHQPSNALQRTKLSLVIDAIVSRLIQSTTQTNLTKEHWVILMEFLTHLDFQNHSNILLSSTSVSHRRIANFNSIMKLMHLSRYNMKTETGSKSSIPTPNTIPTFITELSLLCLAFPIIMTECQSGQSAVNEIIPINVINNMFPLERKIVSIFIQVFGSFRKQFKQSLRERIISFINIDFIQGMMVVDNDRVTMVDNNPREKPQANTNIVDSSPQLQFIHYLESLFYIPAATCSTIKKDTTTSRYNCLLLQNPSTWLPLQQIIMLFSTYLYATLDLPSEYFINRFSSELNVDDNHTVTDIRSCPYLHVASVKPTHDHMNINTNQCSYIDRNPVAISINKGIVTALVTKSIIESNNQYQMLQPTKHSNPNHVLLTNYTIPAQSHLPYLFHNTVLHFDSYASSRAMLLDKQNVKLIDTTSTEPSSQIIQFASPLLPLNQAIMYPIFPRQGIQHVESTLISLLSMLSYLWSQQLYQLINHNQPINHQDQTTSSLQLQYLMLMTVSIYDMVELIILGAINPYFGLNLKKMSLSDGLLDRENNFTQTGGVESQINQDTNKNLTRKSTSHPTLYKIVNRLKQTNEDSDDDERGDSSGKKTHGFEKNFFSAIRARVLTPDITPNPANDNVLKSISDGFVAWNSLHISKLIRVYLDFSLLIWSLIYHCHQHYQNSMTSTSVDNSVSKKTAPLPSLPYLATPYISYQIPTALYNREKSIPHHCLTQISLNLLVIHIDFVLEWYSTSVIHRSSWLKSFPLSISNSFSSCHNRNHLPATVNNNTNEYSSHTTSHDFTHSDRQNTMLNQSTDPHHTTQGDTSFVLSHYLSNLPLLSTRTISSNNTVHPREIFIKLLTFYLDFNTSPNSVCETPKKSQTQYPGAVALIKRLNTATANNNNNNNNNSHNMADSKKKSHRYA